MVTNEGIQLIDLEDRLVAWPGAFELRPGEKERLVADVIAELDIASRHRRTVLMGVNSPGGHFTAGFDLWAAIKEFRTSGLDLVVGITGKAVSAASVAILGASYIAIWPGGYVGVHGSRPLSVAPATVPEFKSACLEAIIEAHRDPEFRGTSPDSMVYGVYEQWTLGSPEQIKGWLGSNMTYFNERAAVALGFADAVLGPWDSYGVAVRYARGETVRSPRREALAALGRGDAGSTGATKKRDLDPEGAAVPEQDENTPPVAGRYEWRA